MDQNEIWTYTAPELRPILAELQPLEPIFHTLEFAATPADYKRVTAPDFWEVGASGRRYERDFILEMYKEAPPLAEELGWQARDHALRQLGPETFLLTYCLLQGERLTRRATIWERTDGGWRVLYHQGTIVAAEDEHPAQS